MNRGELTTQMALFAGDPTETRYTGLYDDAANRAQEQFALETKILWKDTTFTSADADADYDLPDDFMWEDEVLFDGIKLHPISRHRLNALKPGDDWTDDKGTPTHFLIDPEEAVKELLLYPIPEAGDADKTISLRYFVVPAEMTTDGELPLNSSDLMVQFHMGIAAYGAWLLLMTEETTEALAAKKQELLALWNHTKDEAVNTFKNTQSEPMRIRPIKSYGDSGWGNSRP